MELKDIYVECLFLIAETSLLTRKAYQCARVVETAQKFFQFLRVVLQGMRNHSLHQRKKRSKMPEFKIEGEVGLMLWTLPKLLVLLPLNQ